jgi:hypothetical protein
MLPIHFNREIIKYYKNTLKHRLKITKQKKGMDNDLCFNDLCFTSTIFLLCISISCDK